MSNDIEIELTGRQDEAWEFLTNDQNEAVLYGGAKGGGKSFLFCLWTFSWINSLIDYFDLTDTSNPVPLGFLGRKQSIDFYSTTLETWKKIIPPENYRITEMPHKEIIVKGVAKVLYGGLDRAETINKFNSAEYAFFAIDQAEECERKDVSVLEGSLRLMVNGKKPPYKILYTANPAECFLKEDFYRGARKNARYVPALYTDNPHLPIDYGDRLDSAFKHDPEMLEAYKKGNWDLLSKNRNVITSKMLDDLKNINFEYPYTKKLIANDAALGGDECVIYYIENYKIKEQSIGHWNDSKHVAAEILSISVDHKCKNVCVDYIGLGEGIYSRCNEFKLNTIPIISSEKPKQKANIYIKFLNKRAEMWWKVRELVLDKKIPYPKDEKLRKQLVSVRFVLKNGKIVIEEKNDIRKRLGESPDRADAWIYGIYIMWYDIEAEKVEDSYDFDDDEEEEEYEEVADM